MKFGFSILHYQTLDETMNCIASITNRVPDAWIAVVDNNSPNGTGRVLKNRFSGCSRVTCLIQENNLGFANGNNVGYRYLKSIGCEFIACINNDTLILEDGFQKKILDAYKKFSYAACAPAVILTDGSYQRFNFKLKSISDYKDELNRWQASKSYADYYNSKDRLTRMLMKFPKFAGEMRRIKQLVKCPYKYRMKNVVLHGCFIVFSPVFIERFEDAFDCRTFMYGEEELLYLKIRKADMENLYLPDIKIRHLEDIATNSVYRNREDKFQFMRENNIVSLNILIRELEGIGKKSEGED